MCSRWPRPGLFPPALRPQSPVRPPPMLCRKSLHCLHGRALRGAHCFSIKWGWGEKPEGYSRCGSKGGKAERCSCNQTLLPRWSSTEAPNQEQQQRRGEAGGLPLPQEPSWSPSSPRTTLPTGLGLQVRTCVHPRLLGTTWALPSSKGRWVDVGSCRAHMGQLPANSCSALPSGFVTAGHTASTILPPRGL